MLETGQPAPSFCLPDSDMEMLGLEDFKGKNLILYFYPKDDTPGCTIQATEFSELEEDLAHQDTVVLGVSRDDCISHAAFRDKHGLSVRLLADTEGEMCEAYGVWQEKEKDGVKKMGIVRSTFIIDKQGVLRHALYGVSPRGHAAEAMRLVQNLEQA
ncbi:MAG: peroxiredoxin [Sulfuricella denitrificans]|nr:peroxiredoxin [Sulfuricella denitrificans]